MVSAKKLLRVAITKEIYLVILRAYITLARRRQYLNVTVASLFYLIKQFYFGLKKKRIILAIEINKALLPKHQSAFLHEF